MRIDYEKVSGALYIKIRDGGYSHTEDFSAKADVYLDVDAEGNVLGLESLFRRLGTGYRGAGR